LLNWIVEKLIIVPGIIIGLSVHEFGHAKVAELCGDDTARLQGRVSLDPLAHIDLIGFISLFILGFGWGKPVIINPMKLKKPRRDSILIGLAGVFNNFLCAWLFALILRVMYQFFPEFAAQTSFGSVISDMVVQTIIINLSLMLFNLLPIPPLDGFGVISDLISLPKLNMKLYIWLRRYGQIILIALVYFGVTSNILNKPLTGVFYWILDIAMKGL